MLQYSFIESGKNIIDALEETKQFVKSVIAIKSDVFSVKDYGNSFTCTLSYMGYNLEFFTSVKEIFNRSLDMRISPNDAFEMIMKEEIIKELLKSDIKTD